MCPGCSSRRGGTGLLRAATFTAGGWCARRSAGPGINYYELRHFCATHLLELGVAHADVAAQLGHTDGGALVTSTYGHPSEDAARERLKRAYAGNLRRL